MRDDEQLTPDQAQMLADALDLEHGGDVTAVANGILRRVHRPSQCAGQPCWVHHPSDHPLSAAPIHIFGRLAWRECPHGQLHPDPDALWHETRTSSKYAGRVPRSSDLGWHPESDCDGCCREGK